MTPSGGSEKKTTYQSISRSSRDKKKFFEGNIICKKVDVPQYFLLVLTSPIFISHDKYIT